MSVHLANQYMEQASEYYLAGNLEDARRYARAAIAQIGTTTMAMTGGGQVQAQMHVSHQQILDFITQIDSEIESQSSSRRIRSQAVEYRRAGASEC